MDTKYKAMYKYELADKAGVSNKTFNRWLKTDIQRLQEMGVKTSNKLLPPVAVEYICRKYAIDL